MVRKITWVMAFMLIAIMAPIDAFSAENERYQIVNIKRDVQEGKENRTVSGTMMLDGTTGRSWILDEQKGRWIPVGYRNVKPSADVTLTPAKLK